jgi:hypothetical protein
LKLSLIPLGDDRVFVADDATAVEARCAVEEFGRDHAVGVAQPDDAAGMVEASGPPALPIPRKLSNPPPAPGLNIGEST